MRCFERSKKGIKFSMAKNKIKNYEIFSVIFTFIFGTILHFTFNLSSGNSIIALFSSINESVWEHLKLIFFPMLITTIIGHFYFKKGVPNFLCAKTTGIVSSMFFLISFFYTYTGVLGKNFAIIDISSFFLTTIIGEYIAYRLMINKFNCNNKISSIILIVIFICFVVFTYFTPNIGLFKDPVTKQYGIVRKYLK